MAQFDTMQTYGKDGMEAVQKSFEAFSKGVQTAAAEVADYAKRSFTEGSSAAQKLVGVRTLDKVLEIQNDFARSSYESFVLQASKMAELATNTARETAAPMEGLVARTAERSA